MKKLLAVLTVLMGLSTVPAYSASVEARVNLSKQRMHVYEHGRLKYTWPISSGRKGYGTPTGNYRAQNLSRMHYSRKYDNAPMPYSIFFRGGYAIHGTNSIKRLGSPASHGCIRLHPGNAATLYNMVQRNGRGNTRISISY